jgi:hypothetical protein
MQQPARTDPIVCSDRINCPYQSFLAPDDEEIARPNPAESIGGEIAPVRQLQTIALIQQLTQ